MPTVVIIDNDARSRALVHNVAPSDWLLLDAANGLSGLDLIRQHYRDIDLVVLEMELPDVDGRIVSVCIHELRSDLPLLPFTVQANTIAVYQDLACLPPIFKPARPDDLAHALRAAIMQPAPQYSSNPMIEIVRSQSLAIEQLARRQRLELAVDIFAVSAIKRAGLLHLLANAVQTYEAVHLPALELLLQRRQMTAIVAPAEDFPQLVALSREYRAPLIMIAADVYEATLVQTVEVAGILLERDPAIAVRLTVMLQAIATGVRPTAYYPLDINIESAPRHIVPPVVLQRFAGTALTLRALDILWLDYQGLTTEQIARTLNIVPATVDSHWKRIQRVVKHNRKDVQGWVRRLLEDCVWSRESGQFYERERYREAGRMVIIDEDPDTYAVVACQSSKTRQHSHAL